MTDEEITLERKPITNAGSDTASEDRLEWVLNPDMKNSRTPDDSIDIGDGQKTRSKSLPGPTASNSSVLRE